MTVTVFYYTETTRRPWVEQVARGAWHKHVSVPDDCSLESMLEAAYSIGVSRGSQRSGIFEVQTPDGSWLHHNPAFRDRSYGKLDPAKAVFIPHTDLDTP